MSLACMTGRLDRRLTNSNLWSSIVLGYFKMWFRSSNSMQSIHWLAKVSGNIYNPSRTNSGNAYTKRHCLLTNKISITSLWVSNSRLYLLLALKISIVILSIPKIICRLQFALNNRWQSLVGDNRSEWHWLTKHLTSSANFLHTHVCFE